MKSARGHSTEKSGRCTLRQRLRLILQERSKPFRSAPNRPFGNRGRPSLSVATERRVRPSITAPEHGGVRNVVRRSVVRRQPLADPSRDIDRDSVADQAPPVSREYAGRIESGQSPVCRKTLQPFSVTYVRCDDRSGRQQNRRWRGDPDTGTTLQRRNGADRPANAAVSLGPLEAAGIAIPRRGLARRADIGFQQDARRIPAQRGDDKHAPATLWQSERSTVDDAIRPGIAEFFQP